MATLSSITIRYTSKYGECPSNIAFSTNVALTEAILPTLIHPDGVHVGWYTTETFEDDTKVEVGDTLSSSVTLYAKWIFPNKVVCKGETLLDLSAVTVSADTMLEGVTAHGANGEPVVGTVVYVDYADGNEVRF